MTGTWPGQRIVTGIRVRWSAGGGAMHERPAYRPAGHYGLPGPVNRGLSGTGRVGDDLYLVAHDDRTGKAQVPKRQLGLGLAAGLLAELMLGGSVCLRQGYVAVAVGARRPGHEEPLAGRVRDLISAEPDLYPVRDWLRLLAQTAARDIADRLAEAGYLTRAGSRVPWRPARYVPADPDWAYAALSRVRAALDPARPFAAREVTLAGLVDAAGLGHRLDHDLSPSGVTVGQAVALLPPDLRELIMQTRAAADRIVLAHRTLEPPTHDPRSLKIMSRTRTPAGRPGAMSQALARDRLGVPSVLFFILASIAPMTVAAGVIPTAYAVTGLTGIPVAFLAVAIILALFCAGYIAMSRRIRHAGAFYGFVAAGLGKVPAVAAALMALLAYESFQVASYGALGPSVQAEAAAHLHVHWPWWAWALIIWAVVAGMGLARVEVAARVLAVLTTVEVIITLVETISGLTSPAGGHVDTGALSPSMLTSAGVGTIGVLAVIAGLAFVGFEQSPVLAEEARNPRRTIPRATYTALAAIAVLYASAAWAMEVHAGRAHVAAAAAAQGPGLLYSLSASSAVAQSAQLLFITSLFAAALAYHNVTWRYMFALSREGVLPAALSRTSRTSIPRAASVTQSLSGLAVIVVFAAARWPAMNGLFFGGVISSLS
jgi:amino acid transporter